MTKSRRFPSGDTLTSAASAFFMAHIRGFQTGAHLALLQLRLMPVAVALVLTPLFVLRATATGTASAH